VAWSCSGGVPVSRTNGPVMGDLVGQQGPGNTMLTDTQPTPAGHRRAPRHVLHGNPLMAQEARSPHPINTRLPLSVCSLHHGWRSCLNIGLPVGRWSAVRGTADGGWWGWFCLEREKGEGGGLDVPLFTQTADMRWTACCCCWCCWERSSAHTFLRVYPVSR